MLLRVKRASRKPVIAIVVGVVAMGALAACGSDDSKASASGGSGADSSACVDAASAAIADYSGVPEKLPADLTPLSKPTEPGVLYNIFKSGVPSDIAANDSMEKAAEAAGWDFKGLATDSTVEDVNAKFRQAIQEGATAITMSSQDPSTISGPINEAKAAGIAIGISSVEQKPTTFPGYSAEAFDYSGFDLVGKLLGNYTLKQTSCDVHAVVVPLGGISQLEGEGAVIKKTIEDACSSCSATLVPVQISDLGSAAGPAAITSAVQADPSINYVILTLGTLSTGLSAALKTAGMDNVKLIGGVPDDANYQAIAAGTEEMWVNFSPIMNSWALFDAVLRSIDTQAPASGLTFPLSIVTKSELPDGYKTGAVTYPTDYQEEFTKLWQGE